MSKLIAIGVCLSAAIASANATVLVPADLGELAREARTIARGRVAAIQPRWTEHHRTIETIVTLEVDAYLKGALGPVVQFRVPGGELGRYRSIVVGAPVFAVDQRVVVFLGARGPAVPYVLGLSQGVFRLEPTARGRGWLVSPPVMMPVAEATRVRRGDPTRRALRLVEFERRVRALAAGAR